MSSCCLCNNNRKQHKDKSFFGFPRDITRVKEWLRIINKVELLPVLLSNQPKTRFKICEDHFHPDHVYLKAQVVVGTSRHTFVKLLTSDAVPTLNKPQELGAMENSRSSEDNDMFGDNKVETNRNVLKSDKPLMNFFKCLIKNDNKQKIVLSDSQIIEILEKELNINITNTHELAAEIYLNTVKSFLKDWPEWEDFDKTIESAKKMTNIDMVNVIYTKYTSFRQYLQNIIQRMKTHVDNVVQPYNTVAEQKESLEVCMDLHCMRTQLNGLILNWPLETGLGNTIFNTTENYVVKPLRFTLKSILNWWDVGISVIFSETIMYKRDNTYKLDHLLLNRKQRSVPKRDEKITTKLQYKDVEGCSKVITNKKLFEMIGTLLNNSAYQCNKDLELANEVLNSVLTDLTVLPENVKVPNSYRRHVSDYPYVRYLSSKPDVCMTKCNYDLTVMETLVPCHEFSFQAKVIPAVILFGKDWFSIECKQCTLTFVGMKSVPMLISHFQTKHSLEPNWFCGKCNKEFDMVYLSSNKWQHVCDVS